MQQIPPTDTEKYAYSIVEGTTVYDSQGEKVGVVSLPTMQGNHLVVEKGWLFTHEIYIPLTSIRAQDANGIYLNLTKEELKDDQWKVPPGGGSEVETASPIPPPVPAPDPGLADLKGGILPGPPVVDPLANP
ncbi:MAG TPA: DUF2171 domain-containing protein [Ktedonobacterales bacterium]|jgi:hypothetical protein